MVFASTYESFRFDLSAEWSADVEFMGIVDGAPKDIVMVTRSMLREGLSLGVAPAISVTADGGLTVSAERAMRASFRPGIALDQTTSCETPSGTVCPAKGPIGNILGVGHTLFDPTPGTWRFDIGASTGIPPYARDTLILAAVVLPDVL